jgi:hypothetical protein
MNPTEKHNDLPDVAEGSFAFMLDPKRSGEFLQAKAGAITAQNKKGNQPDVLVVPNPRTTGQRGFSSTLIRTTFFPVSGTDNAVQCVIGDESFTFDPGGKKDHWQPAILERNQSAGFALPSVLERSKGKAQIPDQIAIAFVPNFPGDRDLHRGLALREREGVWKTNPNDGHKYYQGDDCSVLWQPSELFPEAWWSERKEATLAALDRRFRTIRSDLTADVIDVLFHHWQNTKKRNDSPTAIEKTGITLRQICQYRGIDPKGENIRIAYLSMRDVRAFRLKDSGIDAALFDIDAVKLQPALWEADEPPQADTGFIYSPGFFLSKAIPGEPVYFAPYVRKLWELDPKYHAKAKRLARYLRGEWRMNTEKYLRAGEQPPTRWRTWHDILKDAAIDFEADGKHDPRRFIKSVHEAIETLYDHEAIRECGKAIYHPDDRATYDDLPRKGVLAAWLELRVCIEPPADVRDALKDINKKRIARTITAQEAKALPKSKSKGRPKQVSSTRE